MSCANERLLRLQEVKSRTGLSRSYLYALVQQGNFPKPVKIGKRAVAWKSSEIDQWIADKINANKIETMGGL